MYTLFFNHSLYFQIVREKGKKISALMKIRHWCVVSINSHYIFSLSTIPEATKGTHFSLCCIWNIFIYGVP